MRPLARLSIASAVLAAAVACAAPLTTSASTTASRSALNYGDSISVGTGLYLHGFLPGWSLREDVDVSRHVAEARDGIRAYGAALPRVVLVSLGANDDPRAVGSFAATIADVVETAGPGRCVVWSTVVRPAYAGVPYAGYNTALRKLDRTYRTLRVFDWAALAKANPQWFGRDGVHPTMTGYRARAAALARVVRSCR